MANITKTFSYTVPDEYLGQSGSGTASWTYEGPAYLYVFVRNSDGKLQGSQSYIPTKDATTDQGMAQTRAGLDHTAVLLDINNSVVDATIASCLISTDTGASAGFAQKEFALADGTVYYTHPDPIPPDHAYAVEDITYDIAGSAWNTPFPWHQPWMTQEQHEASRDACKQGCTERLAEHRSNLTAAQIAAADACIAELDNLYTKFSGVAPHMIPFPDDPTLELISDYDYNTDPNGLLSNAATDGQ